MSTKFGFHLVLKNIEQLKKELPQLLANQAQVFFTDTFKAGGWEGNQWKKPNRVMPETKEYKYPMKKGLSRRTKPTLINSGLLRRAVSISARVVSFEKIQLVVDLPYAQRHNEGLDGMPKRQFMGDSPTLRKKQIELIEKHVDKLFNK